MLAVECLELLRGFWELIIRPTFYFTILKNKNKNTILFLAGGEADDASSPVQVPGITPWTFLTVLPLLKYREVFISLKGNAQRNW